MATRPTRAMSAICAMPLTTVQKMIGAISIRIALMKASPSGCIWAPRSGFTAPSRMPAAIATMTWTHSSFHQARREPALLSAVRVVVVMIGPVGWPCAGAGDSALRGELEQPFGIADKQLLLDRRGRGVEWDQIDQITVIGHDLDVRM